MGLMGGGLRILWIDRPPGWGGGKGLMGRISRTFWRFPAPKNAPFLAFLGPRNQAKPFRSYKGP